MKAMIAVVRDFIKTCPYLTDYEKGMQEIGVDFLGEEPETYVVENVPVDPIVKYYTDGSAEKRFAFVFASKEFYGRDALTNIENIGFYEAFAAWLTVKTRSRDLPITEDGKVILSIEPTITPYVFNTEMDAARYQIQCMLYYYEPAPRQPDIS